ncbi:MAG: hypothetical protein ACJ780_18235 [Solirubrobacteraceae bacterium]
MTLFAAVVTASAEVAVTSSRSAKIAILADLLQRVEAVEVPAAVGFLSGLPRQGRIGIGYATIRGIDRLPAAEPSLTITDVDRSISDIETTIGSGSAVRRRDLLAELLGRATATEATFLAACSPAACGRARWPA